MKGKIDAKELKKVLSFMKDNFSRRQGVQLLYIEVCENVPTFKTCGYSIAQMTVQISDFQEDEYTTYNFKDLCKICPNKGEVIFDGKQIFIAQTRFSIEAFGNDGGSPVAYGDFGISFDLEDMLRYAMPTLMPFFSQRLDDKREIQGIGFLKNGFNAMQLAATDGRVMSLWTDPRPNQDIDLNDIILQPSALFMASKQPTCKISVNDNYALLFGDNWKIYSKLIKADYLTEFPPVHQVIPVKFEGSYTFDRQWLLNVLKPLPKDYAFTTINPIEKTITIRRNRDEEIIVKYDNELSSTCDMTINFERQHLVEVLSCCLDSTVKIQYNAPLHPVLINDACNQYVFVTLR